MALFKKKEEKSAYEKLLEAFNDLPEEDKAKFKADIEDIDKAEDEREIDKIEEDKAETPEVADEKAEEKDEETEEIGDKIEETEDEVEDVEETTEEPTTEEPTETEETEVEEEAKEERKDDVVEVMQAKIDALQEKVNSFDAFMEKAEKVLSRFDELDNETSELGLTKQENADMDEDDDNLSAYEYAMKHAIR